MRLHMGTQQDLSVRKNNLCLCGCGSLCENKYKHGHNMRDENYQKGKNGVRKIRKDLTGKKYGRLTVLRRVSNRGRRVFWLCRCDCGKEKEIASDSLRHGSRSCGCYMSECIRNRNILPYGVSMMNHKYACYRKEAEKRGVEFRLSFKDFREITSRDCFYCGAKPSNCSRRDYHNGPFIYQGIDRVDNKKGYFIGNIVPCCKICNHWKVNMSVNDFIDHVEDIYSKIVANRFISVKK